VHVLLFSEKDIEGLKNAEVLYTRCKNEADLENKLFELVPGDGFPNPNQKDLRVSHVIKGGIDFYFCVNEYEGIIDCQFSVPVVGKAEYWNAEDGTISDCPVMFKDSGRMAVPLRLGPRESIVIAINRNEKPGEIQKKKSNQIKEFIINGKWTLKTPDTIKELHAPQYWTDFSNYRDFSGTMTYKVMFDLDETFLSNEIILDLGHVKEFASVVLNTTNLGTRLWRPFHFKIPNDVLLKGENVLEIEVTNSLANEFGKEWLPSGIGNNIKLINQ
jgi:hypothetical protein